MKEIVIFLAFHNVNVLRVFRSYGQTHWLILMKFLIFGYLYKTFSFFFYKFDNVTEVVEKESYYL